MAYRLVLEDVVHGRSLDLPSPRVLVAGYTGRDRNEVARHIAELESFGIPAPTSVPAFYPLNASALLLAPTAFAAPAERASGEAEPVLVRLADGELYLGVGSDHTDRVLERVSILDSKRAFPKLLARELWPLSSVEDQWDELVISSRVDGARLYQHAPLRTLRHPRETLALAREQMFDGPGPLVLFLGTVPLLGGTFSFGGHFRAELADVATGRRLVCEYDVFDGSPSEPTAGWAAPTLRGDDE